LEYSYFSSLFQMHRVSFSSIKDNFRNLANEQYLSDQPSS